MNYTNFLMYSRYAAIMIFNQIQHVDIQYVSQFNFRYTNTRINERHVQNIHTRLILKDKSAR